MYAKHGSIMKADDLPWYQAGILLHFSVLSGKSKRQNT